MKKVLGIILAVISAILFCGGIYLIIFFALYNSGRALWFSLLIGFVPFISVAAIAGILTLIFYLLED